MTSKEALERLNEKLLRYDEHYDYADIELIKQDLERFEQCKNENCDLQIENAELKDRLEELKNTIEILKRKKVVIGHLLECENVEQYNMPFEDNYSNCCLSQAEYELLKGILEDD